MPVPKDVYDFLVDSHPSLADLALWVREVVLAGEPDLTERVYLGWDGIGFRHPDAGYVCAIYPREQEQCGSRTMGSLPPSVGISMTRWPSGCFDAKWSGS